MMQTRELVLAAAGWCLAAAVAPAWGQAAGQAARPNIVFILVDDLRHDALSCAGHPFLKTPNVDRLAAQGTRFSNAFVTTSLCSPSRASILTGTYAHVHGVRGNEGQDPDPALSTFPALLQKSGYRTGYVGKWHMAPKADPRPGFDYWLSFMAQGVYVNPKLNENGRDFQAEGYMTDLLTEYATRFIKEADKDKPFCLYLSHKAVHGDFVPAPRHAKAMADARFPEPPNYRDDLSGKPAWQRLLRVRGAAFKRPPPATIPAAAEVSKWDPRPESRPRVIDYLRAMLAVDDSVGAVTKALQEAGRLDNTIIVFMGDNGFFHAEHNGMGDKRLAYEEALRVPLLAAGPGVAAGKVCPAMVLNIDIAPTLLSRAGVSVPEVMQGRDASALLAGKDVPWRDSFLYEYFQERQYPGFPTMLGVRTQDAKYVRYPEIQDIDELYDLKADPAEMRNLATDPAAKPRIERLGRELERLMKKTGYR